ncbi:MAG: hypothetical protein NUW21_04925, partial [Elusimicrobia bacterium]|nr:hypothetical protein [Elusimicrobiota bacterium]
MPIRGLTDRAATFPRIGALRKGAPKPATGNAPGRDLKHFRFTSDDPTVVEAFRAAYPEEPRDINIYLPYATPDENLSAWREEWKAGGLIHRCDGETCDIWWDRQQKKYRREPIPCPSLKLDKPACKAVGRLSVVIPELRRLGTVSVLTTSLHDILTLQGALQAFWLIRHDLRGIPFLLSRRGREISTPTDNGTRARREKWLISIEPSPRWVELQLAAAEQAATPLLLPAPTVIDLPAEAEDDGEDDAIGDEPTARTPQTARPDRPSAEGPAADFGGEPEDNEPPARVGLATGEIVEGTVTALPTEHHGPTLAELAQQAIAVG